MFDLSQICTITILVTYTPMAASLLASNDNTEIGGAIVSVIGLAKWLKPVNVQEQTV